MPGEHVNTVGWGNNARDARPKDPNEWNEALAQANQGDETRFAIGRLRGEMEKALEDAQKAVKMRTMNVSVYDMEGILKRLEKAERLNKETEHHVKAAYTERDELRKQLNRVSISAIAFCGVFALACLAMVVFFPRIFHG